MNNIKVLIITYYWPPSGGSGVQRWLKFAKYLPKYNVMPIVYVPDNPKYLVTDENLLEEASKIETLRKTIFNPQDIISKNNNKSGVANVSKGGFLSWIRGNFFIPDAKVFWVKPSVKYLTKYVVENNIDVVISSGPPHSMHLIAERVKQKTNVKWVADFRDPWTTLYYNQDFNLTNFAKQKNKRLETRVLKNADVVLTVSKTLAKEFSRNSNHVEVITNGFDDEKVSENITLDTKFSISHIGLLPKQSNPTILWKVLKELSVEDVCFKKDLQICLTGDVCNETLDAIKTHQLQNNLVENGYVTHKKAIRLQKQAQILLLLIPKTKNSKGILTGKLFEYLSAKRPILSIGDEDGDVGEILRETNSGTIVDFKDEQKLKSVILDLYKKYKTQKLGIDSVNIIQFHRKELTAKLSEIIKQITVY